MRDQSIDRAYQEIVELRGQPPHAQIWAVAVKERYVAEYIDGELSLDDLDEYLERVSDIAESLKRVKRDQKTTERTDEPENFRRLAVNEIFAIEAAQLDSVAVFRETWLGSGLLDFKEQSDWVEARQEIEGPASTWLTVLLDADGNPVDQTGGQHGRTTSSRILKFVDHGQDGIRAVPTAANGALFQLAELATILHRRYDWSDAWCSTFVMTGQSPPATIARSTAHEAWPWYRARQRVTISVRLDVKPTTVMEIYRKERRRLLGDQPIPRVLGEHTAKLGIFAAAHSAGYTWAETMRAWNAENPDKRYASEARFTRDARDAFKRIMGEPLNWEGTGQMKGKQSGTN
jgi:hypothetical protein